MVDRQKVEALLARRFPGTPPRQVAAACRADIDYLAVGPVFPTLTKPRRGATGLDLLSTVSKDAPPAFAIGGITRENLGLVLRTGTTRIAVTGAIFRAPDIRRAVAPLRRALLHS